MIQTLLADTPCIEIFVNAQFRNSRFSTKAAYISQQGVNKGVLYISGLDEVNTSVEIFYC